MFLKIKGEVIHGKKLGRTIGFPTANIATKKNIGVAEGTYKVNGLVKGKVYKGVATYRGEIELFEAHFFDFSGDIYGEVIEIIVGEKIRDNMKFHNLDEIKLQIEKDVEVASQKTKNVLTFGTFDHTHPGHKHYLNSAKMYSDTLITIVATDENVEKIKGKKPLYSIDERIIDVEKLNISDLVLPGSNSNPMKWIEIYKPEVICLGYDQKGFSERIEEELKKHNIQSQIIRIDSLRPEMYKSSKYKKV